MKRLCIREVRRAARRPTAPFARQVAMSRGAAAVGTMAASLLPVQLDGAAAQAVWPFLTPRGDLGSLLRAESASHREVSKGSSLKSPIASTGSGAPASEPAAGRSGMH
jgi:hypothetical protein